MPKGNEDISNLLQQLRLLQLEEQRITEQIIQLSQAAPAPRQLQVGDRIRILNRIGKKQHTALDRVATVTKVTKACVSFTTNSGTNTWQIHSNVEHIDSDHDEQHQNRR